MLHIGCHLSSSKGFEAMGRAALSIGADTFQFFTRNPRGSKAKPMDAADAAALVNLMKEHHFSPILAHAPYTMNPCAKDPELRKLAAAMMEEDLGRLEHLPGSMYNFHPGCHVGQGIEAAVELVGGLLAGIVSKKRSTMTLLETMAGKGSEVGRTFEEIRDIIDYAEAEADTYGMLGVCLDTCHVHDAGYNVGEALDDVLQRFEQIIGLQRLKAVHLNDSLNPLASHKDRHAKIGKGDLGLKAFERIINHPALRGLPFYLETPQDDLSGYAEEITLLRGLYKE